MCKKLKKSEEKCSLRAVRRKVRSVTCVLEQKSLSFACVLEQKTSIFACVLKQIIAKIFA
jgi:hypothetical protein